GLGLGVVAAAVVPLVAHGPVALHDGRVLLALGRDGGERVLEARAARFQLVQVGEGGERVPAHRDAARAEDVLRQIADARAARERDRAAVRLHLTRDDAQQRRLPGAVRPGEPDPRAVGHGPGDVVEDDLAPVALGDAGDVEHGPRACRSGRRGASAAQRPGAAPSAARMAPGYAPGHWPRTMSSSPPMKTCSTPSARTT